jgi:RNA polymerase sigma-70 factor, ECF subfamily
MAGSDALPQEDNRSDWFHAELTRAQSALYAYACTLMAGAAEAWDVLQESNRVMWQKASEVRSVDGFLPWAYRVVHYQVMAHRKRLARDRHVFSVSVLERLAERAAADDPEGEDQVAALEDCMAELSPQQREYLSLRYVEGLAVNEIACRVKRSENAVAATLYRARLALARCIEAKAAGGGGQ